jgi:hypothetical protein
MFYASISSTLAKTIETLSALAKMTSLSKSRSGSVSALESLSPSGRSSGSRMTGDADRPGKRPASDLVDARDPSMAVRERLALEVEMRRGR